jgi:hypothetical protein
MARRVTSFQDLSDQDFVELVRIGKEQARVINEMEAALVAGDNQRALTLARELVALEDKVKEV